ncbi:adenylate/guanylate cyclase domain-containing protein [Parasphingorhabdus sp. JC815]|uniref:tetratricopeptide repeat-containing protein n=1 Tax=Parasphingorhabdus sp. JC815 TaxID=3232140 RepID=UPI0034580A3F
MAADDSTALTKAAIDNGNLLLAYDIAISAISKGDSSVELRHLMVLALARMGNSDRAMELFHQYGLDSSPDPHHRSIAARILKDAAFAISAPRERQEALLNAYRAYQVIFEESGDTYPGINAASLAFLGGKTDEAISIASAILDLPEISAPDNYFDTATQAEALLITGQWDAAQESLNKAGAMPDANAGAKASTNRQLELVTKQAGLSQDAIDKLLAPISPPSVIQFCGHIFLENTATEEKLKASINEFLDQYDVGYAYGALAAGADILIAEAVLARGGELNVIMPFAQDDFITQSITPAGGEWLSRFEACMAAASSVTFATEMHYVGDPEQFGYASKVAMGMAVLRAQYLGKSAQQLALWDGNGSAGAAGTGADVAVWSAYGGITHVIDAGEIDRNISRRESHDEDLYKRTVAAILFTDFPGFSKLTEAALPDFWNGIMGNMAKVLDKYPGKILAQNSWGDALLAVTPDATSAASLALEIQASLRDFDYELLGMEESLGMRIGVHYGPAYETPDPITRKTTFYGTEVSRAARIEPVTPPGAIFVTEPFAAILALEAADQYQCRYAGNIEFAKGYGTYPIYQLTYRD